MTGRRLCAHADLDGAGSHFLEPGEACPAVERDGVTLAAWYQNIIDTRDNPPIFRQLVADLAKRINEGKHDGEETDRCAAEAGRDQRPAGEDQ